MAATRILDRLSVNSWFNFCRSAEESSFSFNPKTPVALLYNFTSSCVGFVLCIRNHTAPSTHSSILRSSAEVKCQPRADGGFKSGLFGRAGTETRLLALSSPSHSLTPLSPLSPSFCLMEVSTQISLILTGTCCHGCVGNSELPGMIFPWTQIRMTLGCEV